MLRDGTYCGQYAYDRRLYTPVELRSMLRDAGFESVSFRTAFDGESLSAHTDELVVIARRA